MRERITPYTDDLERYLDELDNPDDFYSGRKAWESDLDSIYRFGTVDLIHPETDFTHVARVVGLSHLLASQLQQNSVEINGYKLTRLALHHDDAEADPRIGDIPTPVKNSWTDEERQTYREIEAEAAIQLAKRYMPPKYQESYMQDSREAQGKQSVEAQIIKIADKWDGLGKTILEIQCGNLDMFPILNNYRNEMNALAALPVFPLAVSPDADYQEGLPDEVIDRIPKLSQELLISNPRQFLENLIESRLPRVYLYWLRNALNSIDPRRLFSGWSQEISTNFMPLLSDFRQGKLR